MTFGEHLRRLRGERGMSQTDLGGGSYSASYISHLEHDRRAPSPELLSHLAQRLGVSPDELTVALAGDVTSSQVDITIGQLQIYDALLRKDFAAVATAAQHLVTESVLDATSTWWASVMLSAEAWIISGEYERSLVAVDQLLSTGVTRSSRRLLASLLSLQARALRASGRLQEALRAASSAVEAAREQSDYATLATALMAKVSASAELGLVEDLPSTRRELAAAGEALPDGQLKGEVAWAVGNLRFMEGDPVGGACDHDRAAKLLTPEADLRTWARFNKASASMRLAAGLPDGIDVILLQARRGLELVGNPEDMAELTIVEAEYLLAIDPARAHEAVASLSGQALSPVTVGDAHRIAALALSAEGRIDEARASWELAAESFEHAGAHERALSIWRDLARRQ